MPCDCNECGKAFSAQHPLAGNQSTPTAEKPLSVKNVGSSLDLIQASKYIIEVIMVRISLSKDNAERLREMAGNVTHSIEFTAVQNPSHEYNMGRSLDMVQSLEEIREFIPA